MPGVFGWLANRNIWMSPLELPPATTGRRPIRLQIRDRLGRPVVEELHLRLVEDVVAVLPFLKFQRLGAADDPFGRDPVDVTRRSVA